MTCFKRIDENSEVYFRKVVKDGRWNVAKQTDVYEENSGEFVDLMGKTYQLKEIASVGFLGAQVYPIYLYNGIVKEEQTYTYVEVDDENAKIIKNYINKNLCKN